MTYEPTPQDAAAQLSRAHGIAARVGGRARWIGVYFIVFGVLFGAATLVLGLVQPLVLRMAIWSAGLVVVMAGMILWAHRQKAVPRGRLRGWPAWAGSGSLYGVALIAGTPALLGRVWYWLPAAVVVALPLSVAGWRELRA